MGSVDEVTVLKLTDMENARGKQDVGEKKLTYKNHVSHFLENNVMQAVSVICTIYALFALDVWVVLFTADEDEPMQVGLAVCFFFFGIEIVLQCVAAESRHFSYDLFLWLDIVATLSLIPDIPWLNAMDPASSDYTLARLGRPARVAARVGRLGRLLRLARIIRLFFTKPDRHSKGEMDLFNDDMTSEVSFMVSKRVVVIVLICIVAASLLAPLETVGEEAKLGFDVLVQFHEDTAMQTNCSKAERVAWGQGLLLNQLKAQVSQSTPLYYVKLGGQVILDEMAAHASLRPIEKINFKHGTCCEVWFSKRSSCVEEAVKNLILIGIVIVMLLGACFILTTDVQRMLMGPMERHNAAAKCNRALVDVLSSLQHTEEPARTVLKIIDGTQQLLNAELVNLFYVNTNSDVPTMELQGSSGMHGLELKGELSIPSGEGIVGGFYADVSAKMQASKSKDGDDTMLAAQYILKRHKNSETYSVTDATDILRRAASAHGHHRHQSAALQTRMHDLWSNDRTVIAMEKLDMEVEHVFCMAIVDSTRGKLVGVLQAINKVSSHSDKRLRLKLEESKCFQVHDHNNAEVFSKQVASTISEFVNDKAWWDAMKNDGRIAMFDDSVQKSTLALPAPHAKKPTEVGVARTEQGSMGQLVGGWTQNSREGRETESVLMQLVQSIDPNLPDLGMLKQWGFPALDYTHEQLVGCALLMFNERGLLDTETVGVRAECLRNFVAKVLGSYKKVPYHNAWHGFTVFHSCYWVLCTSPELANLPPAKVFSMLIAALCHDVGHEGLTNPFHINSQSDHAITYNDESVMEAMHAATCFRLAKEEEGCDVFATARASGSFKSVRKDVIGLILATDMAKHKDEMARFDKIDKLDFENEEHTELLLQVVLHGIDIGNMSLPWPQAVRFGRMLQVEFSKQVAMEEEAGLPVLGFMRCDPAIELLDGKKMDNGSVEHVAPALGKGQVGFLKFVILPVYEAVQRHLPCFSHLVACLDESNRLWAEVGDKDNPRAMEAPFGHEVECMETGREVLLRQHQRMVKKDSLIGTPEPQP